MRPKIGNRPAVLRAHEYWRMKRLAVDLVILNEQAASYTQNLQASLEALVGTSQSTRAARGRTNRQGVCSFCGGISWRPRNVLFSKPPPVRCS